MSKNIPFLSLLMAVLWGVFCLASCGGRPGTVKGTVVDSQSGQPVVDAQVVVYELMEAKDVTNLSVFQKGVILQKQVTDGDGAFSFSLEPADYVIQVWIDGLEVADRLVKVKSGRETPLDLEVSVP